MELPEPKLKQLGVLLAEHLSLRLVFLNACKGEQSLSNTAFSGTAQYLVRQNLPAMIAMQFSVSDKSASNINSPTRLS